MSTIYDWSLNAANNANADDIINWSEGQPPSSVNNSARAMMQRIREYIADIGGTLIAGGSANSVELRSNATITSLFDGILVRFRAVGNNNGNATLNLNGLGARPIFQSNFNGVTALVGGEIKIGGIYEVVYQQSLNNGGGGWFLAAPTPSQAIPTGMIAPFAMAFAPTGWLECNGAAVSRTVYPALFNAIGGTWGWGDGQTSFNLPDFRGVFLRGWDHGRGIDSGRAFATFQDSQNRAHNHGGVTSTNGNHNHNFTYRYIDVVAAGNFGYNAFVPGVREETRTTTTNGDHNHTINSDGGNEARPINLGILYAIKV
ncbi:phage tail protein [Bartonella sp. HY038]|uniref:phage tail protein n=1 Tax=Bartonella sp. HY038 TaxID=2759660 RepID=UPI0015F95E75|nr:phage tail protein [Bartonella sp. HY038]